MPATGNIQYVKHSDIDKSKWDACIERSSNGLVYAYSYYLDYMAKHWDALVLGDYQAVMPLTWNKKYGIHYLYQPPFVASSGIFGDDYDSTEFIKSIPSKFKLIEISLNHGNSTSEKDVITRNNYVLDLHKPYTGLYKNYRENIQRNIKKCLQAGCYCKTNIPVDDIISINKEQLKNVVTITDDDYAHFRTLYEFLYSKQKAITYGIYNNSNELLASCVFFFSHKRAYYILVGNKPNGKTLGASHYLIDRFIADYSNKDLLLDFEGSDFPNLAFFYSSFGATLETYPALRINKLPGWIKWLKK